MVAPEWVVQHPHSARERGATNRAHGIFKGRQRVHTRTSPRSVRRSRYYGTWGSGAAWYSAWHSCPHNSRATGSPVEAISRGYFCAGSRKRRSSPLKSLLIIAAVLAGDPATTDPRLELLTRLFDSQADCERVKTGSTGERKGEIEGKKVLRIVGRCQELTPEEVQQLRDALQR